MESAPVPYAYTELGATFVLGNVFPLIVEQHGETTLPGCTKERDAPRTCNGT